MLIFVGISGAYVLLIPALVYYLRWRRKTRWPFSQEDKLLRAPGEELKRRSQKAEEQLLFEMMGGLMVPPLVWATCNEWLRHIPGVTPGRAFWVGVIGALGCYVASFCRLAKLWRRIQNAHLGWFGERIVGEWLDRTRLAGWRIFHDVPFTADGRSFNIDHVAVGPCGVLVFETKTRRKGKARPGRSDSKVVFNGRELDWPWGLDTHGLEQAERNAQFLSRWIREETTERVHVTPYLVLPGWWLDQQITKEPRVCRVANPKWLPGILAKERPSLSTKQVELISLRLEARCRDVDE